MNTDRKLQQLLKDNIDFACVTLDTILESVPPVGEIKDKATRDMIKKYTEVIKECQLLLDRYLDRPEE